MAEQEPGTRLAEEVRLLLDAVAERAGPWLDRAVREAPNGCACPLCAVLGPLRGEAAGRSLDRIADLVAVLRAVLADRWEPGVAHMPGFRPEPRPSQSDGGAKDTAAAADTAPNARVQRIPVHRKDSS